MRVLLLSVASLLISSAATAGELRVGFTPGGEPLPVSSAPALRRPASPPQLVPRLTRTAPVVALPYYVVEVDDPAGLTTILAVRNRSAATVTVRFRYHAAGSGPLDPDLIETRTLSPHEVRTINLRDLPSLPAVGGRATGYVLAEVIDPNTGARVVDSTALAGDYFRVDPANNFASGAPLLGVGPLNLSFDLCQRWDLRFLNGGAFDGGTDLAFMVDFNPGAESPIARGNVYDEEGTFLGRVEIFTADYAFEVSSLDFSLPVPFGAIEWAFAGGVLGHVSAVLSASGRFSVGMPAICADDLEELDASTTEAAAATTTASLTTVAGATYATALLTADAGTTTPRAASLDYDPESGWWSASIDLPTGESADIRLQLQDAGGNAQQSYDPRTTTTIVVEGEAHGSEGSILFYLHLTGLGATSTDLVVNGSAQVTYLGTTAAVTVENLVVPKNPAAYPQSGTITVATAEVTVTVVFDGSQVVTATYSYLGVTQTFLIDLETGEVVPA